MGNYAKEEIWNAFVSYVKWVGECEGSYYENGPIVYDIVEGLKDEELGKGKIKPTYIPYKCFCGKPSVEVDTWFQWYPCEEHEGLSTNEYKDAKEGFESD
jgi:hypothetical protein